MRGIEEISRLAAALSLLRSEVGGIIAVETILLEIPNSMNPYPMFHAYADKMRPVIVLFEPTKMDEVSNRIPPTSH